MEKTEEVYESSSETEGEISESNEVSDSANLQFEESSSGDNESLIADKSEEVKGTSSPLQHEEIPLPDWYIQPPTAEEDEKQKISSFDVENMHLRLELNEARINRQKDLIHSNPLQVIQASRNASYNLDPQRHIKNIQERKEQYTLVIPTQNKPLFWERKGWDKDEEFLNKEQTEKLKKEIEICSSIRFILPDQQKSKKAAVKQVPKANNSPKLPKSSIKVTENRKKKSQKKKSFILNISALDYNTDDTDEMTDYELVYYDDY